MMRIQFKRVVVFFVTIVFSMDVLATCLLGGYHATYDTFTNNMKPIGSSEETLTLPTAKSFVLSGHINQSFPSFTTHMVTTVKGTYGDNKLTPKSVNFHVFIPKFNADKTAIFRIAEGKYDVFSYILSLRLALLANANKAAGSSSILTLPLQLDAKGMTEKAQFNLDKLPSSMLTTELGRVKTVIVSHKEKENMHKKYWLAPKYGYLPVQFASYDQGQMILINKIKSYEPANSEYCVYKGS